MVIKGRITHLRVHGGVCFFDLDSDLKTIKCKIDKTSTQNYQSIKKLLYRGAMIEINDYKRISNNKELYEIIKLNVISKPHFFPKNYPKVLIKDQHLHYTNKVLCMINDPSLREIYVKRHQIISHIRQKLESYGAIHIDTPVLEQAFGGAEATPFTTNKALFNNKSYYLRVAHEFPLKRFIIAGFPQVYHCGPSFRNEGRSPHHAAEFMQLEYYSTHHTYQEMRKLWENLIAECYNLANNTFIYMGFDLRQPWPVYRKDDLIKIIGQDINEIEIDKIIKKGVLGPVYHLQGVESSPLAKNDEQIYDSYMNGVQVITAYAEQNDYEILRSKVGDNFSDQKFLEHISYGMNNTIGMGLGIDRLVQQILHRSNIRQVQAFPQI